MEKGWLLGVILTVFLVSSVSASIFFSQTENVYNLGDTISVQVDVDPLGKGFLKVDLVCSGNTINVYNGIPHSQVTIDLPLTNNYIEEVSGECNFFGFYQEDIKESRSFEISEDLEIRLNLDGFIVKPGEGVQITGTAKRLNGIGINGEVEITIPLLSLINLNKDIEESDDVEISSEESNESEDNVNESEESDENNSKDDEKTAEEIIEEILEKIESSDNGIFYGKVVDGSFSVNLTLSDTTPAGDYRIDVNAYEKDSLGVITSSGLAMANLKILQVLTSVDIALSEQNIDPGQTLEFKPLLLDQAGNVIVAESSVIIRNDLSERVFESLMTSGDTVGYNVPSNLTAGYYTIEVSSGEVSGQKSVYVNEKAIALFELRENTLYVTNIGNIRYDKDIQVELNGKPFVKKLSLDLGESGEFKLTGDGEYNIKVNDGDSESSYEGVALTGNAVNVEFVKNSLVFRTPIIWIFLIIVLGAGVLFLFRNMLKKKSIALHGKFNIRDKLRFRRKDKVISLSKDSNQIKIDGEAEKPKVSKNVIEVGSAEQVLVLNGNKNRSSVVALKIKNKLSRTSKKYLKEIIEKSSKKSAIYESGDYILLILSPLVTKTFKNEVLASNIALILQKELKDYNKKFKEKIEFGIGINSGMIINKIEKGGLKFTAMGNLMPGAKRLANSSDEKILLSKEAYDKGISNIKADKKKVGDSEVYELKRVIDSEQNKKFVDSFLKRIGENKSN